MIITGHTDINRAIQVIEQAKILSLGKPLQTGYLRYLSLNK